ncbi:MAG: PD40 domain-containing protein [Anaerolineae bacterium]|nr:PD40 domain-containing protein [Anaerolineae bacterium]
MKQRWIKPVLILTLLLALLPTAAPGAVTAQSDGWRVTAAMALEDLGLTPPWLQFAPDGHHVAYGGLDVLCIFDVLTAAEQCVEISKESGYSFSPEDYFPSLRWSPDSSQIALVGVPYKFLRDTDLGLLDLSSLELLPLLDDGYTGNLLVSDDTSIASIETQPAWSHDGTMIAFEQVLFMLGSASMARIALLDVTTGDMRELTTLPGETEDKTDAGSTVGMAWSPDGTTLALSLRHMTPDLESDGIWLLDVESGELEQVLSLQQTADLLEADYPQSDVYAAAPLSWSPDGARLQFWAGNPMALTSMLLCFWMNMDSREITRVELPAHPNEPEGAQFIYPIQATWSPDGSMLLVAAREIEPIPGEEVVQLDPTRDNTAVSLYLFDVATGDRTLLGHLPLVPAPMFVAAWGPDGDVLIDGYHLKLEQP